MKLKNKKTGEIHEIAEVMSLSKLEKRIVLYSETDKCNYNYTSLAELNEEWEDAPEEPKGFWMINILGIVEYTHGLPENEVKMMEEIGNYFETEEEDEKAVEKLKAWKRLKDKGFRFMNYEKKRIGIDLDYISITALAPRDKEPLDLLFGGEE